MLSQCTTPRIEARSVLRQKTIELPDDPPDLTQLRTFGLRFRLAL